MNETTERLLVDWLAEGPDRGPNHGLERALAATHRTKQRPGWTIPERWLPMQLTMRPAIEPAGNRRLLLVVAVGLLALALAGTVAFIGSQRRAAPPFGLAANGSMVIGVGSDLWLIGTAGETPRRLDIGMGLAMSPVFSPDGTKFAFMSRPVNKTPYALFVANADGREAQSVTGGMRIATPELAGITWSPDGSSLVFQSSDAGIDRLFRVGVDGSGLRPITDRSADRAYPAWSPDGQWLTYRVRPVETVVKTYLAISRPDGTDERRITSVDRGDASFSAAQWTGDSQHIAYFRSSPSGHAVGVVDLEGTETILSRPDEDAVNPVVSPDGGRVVFAAYSGAAVVNLDEPASRLEIPAGLAECGATWAPDGSAVLGLAVECTELYRIPLNDLGAASRIDLPAGLINNASWQRLAP